MRFKPNQINLKFVFLSFGMKKVEGFGPRKTLPILGTKSARHLCYYDATGNPMHHQRIESSMGTFGTFTTSWHTTSDNFLDSPFGNFPAPPKPKPKASPSDEVFVTIKIDPRMFAAGGDERTHLGRSYSFVGETTVREALEILLCDLGVQEPDIDRTAAELAVQRIRGYNLDFNCPMWILFSDKPASCNLVVVYRPKRRPRGPMRPAK
jgi:hypothetical protein